MGRSTAKRERYSTHFLTGLSRTSDVIAFRRHRINSLLSLSPHGVTSSSSSSNCSSSSSSSRLHGWITDTVDWLRSQSATTVKLDNDSPGGAGGIVIKRRAVHRRYRGLKTISHKCDLTREKSARVAATEENLLVATLHQKLLHNGKEYRKSKE